MIQYVRGEEIVAEGRTRGGRGGGPEVEKTVPDSRGGKQLEVINLQAKSIERHCDGRMIGSQRCEAPFEVVNQANGTKCSRCIPIVVGVSVFWRNGITPETLQLISSKDDQIVLRFRV